MLPAAGVERGWKDNLQRETTMIKTDTAREARKFWHVDRALISIFVSWRPHARQLIRNFFLSNAAILLIRFTSAFQVARWGEMKENLITL